MRAEAPGADQVRDRLAPATPAQVLAERVDLGRRQRAVVVQVQLEPAEAEHVAEQDLGVEARVIEVAGHEVRAREPEEVDDGARRLERGHATTAPASRISRSARSVSPAATSTPRTPSASTVTAKPSRSASSTDARTQ